MEGEKGRHREKVVRGLDEGRQLLTTKGTDWHKSAYGLSTVF
jgi:hypothetical protein